MALAGSPVAERGDNLSGPWRNQGAHIRRRQSSTGSELAGRLSPGERGASGAADGLLVQAGEPALRIELPLQRLVRSPVVHGPEGTFVEGAA